MKVRFYVKHYTLATFKCDKQKQGDYNMISMLFHLTHTLQNGKMIMSDTHNVVENHISIVVKECSLNSDDYVT